MEGGEHARFTQMYERFYPRVLGYAARRVALDQAREVADETFLVAWRKLSDIPEAAVLPWLLVVARHTIVDQVRRGRRQDALALELTRCVEKVNQPERRREGVTAPLGAAIRSGKEQ
ncbi:MAG TPA: sigma factor [Mycobacteriales bacterium]|jgi:DNA-directed RNA polymerase specialized sigma subunit, sigma24 homolog